MGAVKRYYLVIRDKTNNDYNIINVCDRYGHSNRSNRLEVIDDLTTHYRDGNEFISDLLEQGYINDGNVDLFIVSPNSKSKNLDYFELVYNSHNKRDEKLKKVIDSSLDGDLNKEEDNIKYILDRFADLMCYDDEFNNIVDFGYSNVSKKYINYFKNKKGSKPFYQVRFKDGEWALHYYPLIRNIVDIIDRYDTYKRSTSETFEKNLDYYKRVTPGRRKITKYLLDDIYNNYFGANQNDRLSIQSDLLLKTDKNYIEGQLTFNDYYDEEETKKINDIDTKITIVMDVFKHLPRKVFSQLEDKSIIFNTNMFLTYENEEDKNTLSNLLPSDLLKDIENFIVNLNRLSLYSSRVYDTDNLTNEVKHYKTKIYNRLLDNLSELNDAYSWCMLYNKCMEDDINYRRKLGEDNGKVYDKYGERKNEAN